MFILDKRLREDTIIIGQFPLSLILLMNDANYPWFILVPQRAGVREVFELQDLDQVQLVKESSYFAKQLTSSYQPDKINIAALGNIVPQLHLHHLVRFRSDAAWPDPVWGKVAKRPYNTRDLEAVRERVVDLLENGLFSFRAGTDETTHRGFSP